MGACQGLYTALGLMKSAVLKTADHV